MRHARVWLRAVEARAQQTRALSSDEVMAFADHVLKGYCERFESQADEPQTDDREE